MRENDPIRSKKLECEREIAKEIFLGSFLFVGLPRERAEQLCNAFEFSLKELKKGESILCHGSNDHCFGVIVCGRALVSRASGGRRVILRHLEDGAFFGVSSLFGGEAFPTDIVADTTCIVATATEGALESLLKSDGQIAMNYIRFLSGRIRFLNDSIDSYSIRSADEKIAKFILRECAGGEGVVESYTRTADALGIGRASLYRALDSLENRGVISRQKQKITILDANSLKQIAFGE